MPNRYSSITNFKDSDGKRYLANAVYPDIPETQEDIYIITAGTDRYDTLAKQFYNDSSLWWIIASANNSKKDSLVVEKGIQLRIAADGPGLKAKFKNFNNKLVG